MNTTSDISGSKSAFKRTEEMWQKTLILVVWDSWFELWSVRNGGVHGKTRTTRAQAERREVDRQLTELYAARQFMEAEPVIRKNVRKIRKVPLRGERSLRNHIFREQGTVSTAAEVFTFAWC